MIGLYVGFFVLGVAAFFLMSRFALPWRIAVALAVFLIPSIAMTALLIRVGDRPQSGAIIVVPAPPAD